MEMEGRGFSELLRSSNEEILIKGMMDNQIGNSVPSMEMLGFKNVMQPFRADSEELFSNWLTNGEIPVSAIAHRTRQVSVRNPTEDRAQAGNFYTAKEWLFQPLASNRELEPMRKYASIEESQNIMAPPFKNSYCNISTAFMPPSCSSSSFSTLECRKFDSKVDKDVFEGRSYGIYELSPVQVANSTNLEAVEKPFELTMEDFRGEGSQVQLGIISQEPSQSDSMGFEGGGVNSSLDKDFRERMLENNFKNSRKKESLARMDSISSSVGMTNFTKIRRVERSRKMAEAKERIFMPSMPSDMQEVLKRCDNLEKEVRSLKLNLSFMNRKDSEQSKQIEELQNQNEELTEEMERLMEERANYL